MPPPRRFVKRNPKNRSPCRRRTELLKVSRRPSAPRLPVLDHYNFEAGRPQIKLLRSLLPLSGASVGHLPQRPSGRRLYPYLRRAFWRVSPRVFLMFESTSRVNRHSSRVRPAELVAARRGRGRHRRRGSIFVADPSIGPPCRAPRSGRRGSSSWKVASAHVYKVLAPRTRFACPQNDI